jgi:hypothetical protein
MSYPAWTFEKYAFAVKLRLPPQQGGLCPAGTQNLYRAYNNGLGGDPNHRYSTDGNLLGNMGGWATEGLVMCLPQVTGAGLPAQLIACYGADCPDDAKINNGPDLVNLVADIANPTATPIDFVVPAGQTFISVAGLYQDGFSVERLQVTIAPGTTRKIVLRMFCMQHTRAPAPSGAVYTTGPVTGNAALLDLVSITHGKLDVSLDPLTLKRGTVQFAIWVITDLTGSLSALQRSLLVQLMATAPDDVDTQAMLSAEFSGTVPDF